MSKMNQFDWNTFALIGFAIEQGHFTKSNQHRSWIGNGWWINFFRYFFLWNSTFAKSYFWLILNVSGLKHESGASTPDGSDLMFANCISMPPIPFGGGSTVTLKPIDEEECDITDPYSVCSQVRKHINP